MPCCFLSKRTHTSRATVTRPQRHKPTKKKKGKTRLRTGGWDKTPRMHQPHSIRREKKKRGRIGERVRLNYLRQFDYCALARSVKREAVKKKCLCIKEKRCGRKPWKKKNGSPRPRLEKEHKWEKEKEKKTLTAVNIYAHFMCRVREKQQKRTKREKKKVQQPNCESSPQCHTVT